MPIDRGGTLEGQQLVVACAGASPQLRRGRSSAVDLLAAKQLEEGVDPVLANDVFYEQVRRVLLAADLHKLDTVVADPLLDPEALRVDAVQLAKSSKTVNA